MREQIGMRGSASATCVLLGIAVDDGERRLGTFMSSFVLTLGWVESVIITLLVGSIVMPGLGATWVPQTLSK